MFTAAIGAFFVENQVALLFYGIIILLIVLFRNSIEWQAFGIGMYKTKAGLKLMERWGTKHRGLVQLLGYIGVGVGFIGMATIVFILGKGFVDLFWNPAAPPVIAPVIPGFNILGHDLKVPLVTGWLALFVVIVIHEFSHGVVSRAHNIKVKSSGLLVFGPIAGAFVEPEEEVLKKSPPIVQYSLFAAGPWSNILSAFLFMLILGYGIAPAILGMTTPVGVEIATVTEGFPAAAAGLAPTMLITSANGAQVREYADLTAVLDRTGVGDTLTLGTSSGEFTLVTTQNPQDPASAKGYLGVTLSAKREPNVDAPWFTGLLAILTWLKEFVNWIVILSLGLGLANLLPIGPIDGGRMLQIGARQVVEDEKRGDHWWKRISLVVVSLVLLLLIVPIARIFF